MGFCSVRSAAVFGLKVEFVNVEADSRNGLPIFHMVGYLSSEVKEAGERVRTAIRNSELDFPAKKIVINLSPATRKKRGAAFDLPIAVSILASLGEIPEERLETMLIVGELQSGRENTACIGNFTYGTGCKRRRIEVLSDSESKHE